MAFFYTMMRFHVIPDLRDRIMLWLYYFVLNIGVLCEIDGSDADTVETKSDIPAGSHYDWQDGIIILDTSNFNQIYESNQLWMVLFYSKWCSHCLGFSDTFKQFAFDIRDWSPWIRVAAMDCAEEGIDGGDNGKDICFRMPYVVSSMPDLRFFPANLQSHTDPSNDHAGVKRKLDLSSSRAPSGETIWTGADINSIRKVTLDFLGINLPKQLVNFKPITTDGAQTLIDSNAEYLALFFEERKDQTMKTAQMDVAGYTGITVRRMNINTTDTELFMKTFDLKIEPCFIIFHKNSLLKRCIYPGFGKRAHIRKLLRSLDITPPVYDRLENEVLMSELRGAHTFDNFKTVDHSKIYMQDLESALYYMIKKEALAKV